MKSPLHSRPFQSPFSYIETFAGCGGLSLGLHFAGWAGHFAIERDPMAFQTLRTNLVEPNGSYHHFKKWPHWLPCSHHTIEDVLDNATARERIAQMRGKVDLLAGGPPCQGFSVGGARRGDDARNSLVFRHLELASILDPSVVLIENVEGFTRKFDARPTEATSAAMSDHVVQKLTCMGYTAGYYIVTASDFGVPQNRKRMIILAFKREIAARLPSSSLLEVDIRDVVVSALENAAGSIRKAFGLHMRNPVTVYEALHDLASSQRVPCPDSNGYESAPYLKAKSKYAAIMRCGIADGSVPNSHRFSKHGPKVEELYKQAHQTQRPGRLPRSFLLDNGTKTQKKVLLDRDGVSTTLTTHPDEQIHYAFPRNVTLREMARFQSFPDDFVFTGRYTLNGPRRKLDVPRCAQIGNAVPPFLGCGIGLAISEILRMAGYGE